MFPLTPGGCHYAVPDSPCLAFGPLLVSVIRLANRPAYYDLYYTSWTWMDALGPEYQNEVWQL